MLRTILIITALTCLSAPAWAVRDIRIKVTHMETQYLTYAPNNWASNPYCPVDIYYWDGQHDGFTCHLVDVVDTSVKATESEYSAECTRSDALENLGKHSSSVVVVYNTHAVGMVAPCRLGPMRIDQIRVRRGSKVVKMSNINGSSGAIINPGMSLRVYPDRKTTVNNGIENYTKYEADFYKTDQPWQLMINNLRIDDIATADPRPVVLRAEGVKQFVYDANSNDYSFDYYRDGGMHDNRVFLMHRLNGRNFYLGLTAGEKVMFQNKDTGRYITRTGSVLKGSKPEHALPENATWIAVPESNEARDVQRWYFLQPDQAGDDCMGGDRDYCWGFSYNRAHQMKHWNTSTYINGSRYTYDKPPSLGFAVNLKSRKDDKYVQASSNDNKLTTTTNRLTWETFMLYPDHAGEMGTGTSVAIGTWHNNYLYDAGNGITWVQANTYSSDTDGASWKISWTGGVNAWAVQNNHSGDNLSVRYDGITYAGPFSYSNNIYFDFLPIP